jgi:chromosome partitioning related protein ParA
LSHKAIAGAYEFIALNQTDPAQIISTTEVAGLNLIISNDNQGRLSTLLLHAPDGRLRLRALLNHFRPRYYLLLINTQARSVLLEMAILAIRSRPLSDYTANARRTRTTPWHLEAAQRTRTVPPPGNSTTILAAATEPGERH